MASLYQVKASAGSGKTYDLTRRFLCLLAACGAPAPAAAASCGLGTGPSGWDEILAITFTNAAAGEMRDRVIGRLKAIALGTPEKGIPLTPDMAARWLDVILRDLASLNIRTIDSLLHAIVRSAALQLDLPPDFQPAFVSMDAVTPYLDTLLNQASQGNEKMEKLLRDLLERRGLIEDSSIRNEKARVAEKELRRNMYHNTQVMLKNYRDIVWALECFPGETAQELEQPLKDVDALLSAVDAQIAMGNAKLEHRLLSIRKSRLLLDRINEALTVLRHKPGNGEMLYNIIFQTFITPDKPSHSEILYRLDISERHYYRLRQQAVNILSIRLWTAPQGCLDAWLEILTLLEG